MVASELPPVWVEIEELAGAQRIGTQNCWRDSSKDASGGPAGRRRCHPKGVPVVLAGLATLAGCRQAGTWTARRAPSLDLGWPNI